jgi:hypothetical protein
VVKPATHICAIAAFFAAWPVAAQQIDRHALVMRHQPVLRSFDAESPLSVGNGRFAFTVDATGLQTFAEAYVATTPLCTMSEWGWHTSPNRSGWSIDTYDYTEFESHGRRVGYADVPGGGTPESNYLRENPHRLHLGRIGFRLVRADGRPAEPADLTDVRQTLDLWNGVIVSHFRLDDQPVDVQTVCHPALDLVAVRVVSPLVSQRRLGIEWRFPYGSSGMTAADWDHPAAHTTTLSQPGQNQAAFDRRLDNDQYYVATQWSPAATLRQEGPHQFVLMPSGNTDSLELVCEFTPNEAGTQLPTFAETLAAACEHWNRFWSTGGAIDLSSSSGPRWRELERRIVLSQYLTAIQSAGRYPPAETGLTCNSWYGKFHLEMHWWHAVHFALWDRLDLLERSLGYYQAILPRAQATARRQGYEGARWPKMTDPSGAESPSSVGPFLIWQQPHPIYYAELCYRAHGDRATLEKYRDVVFDTARFMASYATWDEATQRYVLGPVLQCAQERFPKTATLNPTFELTYWRWGLETAQKWRERLGLPRDEHWDHVLEHLARPLVVDGKYAFAETAPDSYTNPRWNDDHPAVLAALGMLPGPGIDPPTMRRTLHWVHDNWNWPSTWGWDYPMVAMCAARLGEPELAVDALLMDTPKNIYRANGHNYQRPGLSVYLPGNGGLLTAAAMMAAGWDGAPDRHAPGFPDDGSWQVRYENLRPMP